MARLGDICTKASSNIAQKDLENCNGEYPIYGASGLIKYVDFYQQENPYVAVVKDGAGVGRVMQLPAKSSVIGTMQYIIPHEGTNVSYLAYAMEHMGLEKYYTGATIPHIYFKDYSKETLQEHNADEQHQIASVLDKLNTLISLRNQQLAKLDELVKARFVEMFGDRFSNDRNWDTKLLANVVDFCNGKAHEQVVDIAGKYILVTSKCIASDFVEFRTTNVCLFPLQKNDIVMVMSDVPKGRAIAKCKLIKQDNLFTLNQRICCFRNYDMNPCFLCHLLNRHEYFLGFDDGDSQTNLRKDEILGCKLIIPPVYLQEQYAKFVAVVEYKKLTIQKSLDKLEMLKKALTQEYFG